MYDERDKTWTTDGDPLCPHCEEPLYFNEETDDIVLADEGQVWVEWNANCKECGREFKVREYYSLTHMRIFEKDW